jgi:hypothetical protein
LWNIGHFDYPLAVANDSSDVRDGVVAINTEKDKIIISNPCQNAAPTWPRRSICPVMNLSPNVGGAPVASSAPVTVAFANSGGDVCPAFASVVSVQALAGHSTALFSLADLFLLKPMQLFRHQTVDDFVLPLSGHSRDQPQPL